MSAVFHSILSSPRVPHRLKNEVLGLALATLKALEQGGGHLAPMALVMRAHLIEPYGLRKQNCYLNILKQCFDEQDRVLRANLRGFRDELDAARESSL